MPRLPVTTMNCIASSSKTVWRGFSVSAARSADSSEAATTAEQSSAEGEAAAEGEAEEKGFGSTSNSGFRGWIAGEGARFRHPVRNRTNYIGDTPFPMNPWFNPKPPLSDQIKTNIYVAYVYNAKNARGTVADSVIVRALSLKFGVGMDRIRAIIRLKELEEQFQQQNIPLQTELLKGMESCLGVKPPGQNWKGSDPEEEGPPSITSKKPVFEMLDTESDEKTVFLPLVERARRAYEKTKLEAMAKFEEPAAKTTDDIEFRNLDGTPEASKWQEKYQRYKTKQRA